MLSSSRPALFTVMTYNLLNGGAGREQEISEVIASVRPHAAVLTEADDPQVVSALAERHGMQPLWAKGSGDRHIALLSRLPILSWKAYNRPPLTQAVLQATLDLSQHVEKPHVRVTLYGLHLLPYLLLPFEVRRAQALGALLELIYQNPAIPHLILGDVNSIAPGDRVLQRRNPARMRRVMALQGRLIFRLAIPRLLKAGYVDCYRGLHPHALKTQGSESPDKADGFTWKTGNRTSRYDYVFADPKLARALKFCRVVDDIPEVESASDHYPLAATFDLSPASAFWL